MRNSSTGFLNDDSLKGRVRLRTLIILRWIAISGQSVAVLVAQLGLNLQIDLGLCYMAIAASVITNLVAMFVFPPNKMLPEREVMITLLFDLTQLAFLLYLTGGLNNPFALLILAPVTVSAMTIRSGYTILMGLLAFILVTMLARYYVPLRTNEGFFLDMPDLFLIGFWAAINIGLGFLAIYASRVTTETFAMSQALLATQMALSREQKLTDLGGVVAAAAHELGTPLATIKLVSAELIEELENNPELRDDAALIREQADRCGDILHSMGRAGKDDLHLRSAPLRTVVEEAAEPHSGRGKTLHYHVGIAPDSDGKMPIIQRKPEIIHGVRNLLQNAVDFAKSEVWIDIDWTDTQITIRIVDDGPGYPGDLLGRIGDPFLRRRPTRSTQAERPEYEGMGLGLFIAKTLLERSGGEISFANGAGDISRNGAIAEVIWDIEAIIAPSHSDAGALGENKPFEA
ncbi:MAG: ActS/PrrB/RegB family redox-sensitive histidine kinase [Litoreibacter sp.]